MATATTADFFGAGGDIANPFSTEAAPPGAVYDATAAQNAFNSNNAHDPNSAQYQQAQNAYRAYATQRASSDQEAANNGSPQWWEAQFAAGTKDPNDPQNAASYKAAKALQTSNHEANNTLGYKLLTGGILAAPALITGGAAAFGGAPALGFGEGAAVGGAAPAAAASAVPDAVSGAGAPVLAGAGGSAGGAAPAAAAAAGGSPFLNALGAGAAGAGINLAGHLAVDALAGGKTGADKALIAKQDQLASEAAARRDQGSQAAMDMMAQRMLAFAPMNNYLSMIGGQGNALSPETVSSMVHNPYPPQLDPALQNYQGNDPSKLQEIQAYQQRMAQYQAAESARSQAIQQGFPPPPPQAGTPMMPPPMPAKKYF